MNLWFGAASELSKPYDLLISLLDKRPKAIEILPVDGSTWMSNAQNPGGVEPFLFVEGNLGVPQKILHKLYLRATHIFKSTRNDSTSSATQWNPDPRPDASLVQSLIASSSILLLANPAHQTALNARKRLVQLGLIDPNAELDFMASLLSSQHCAKHAELWYHRRWLLSAPHDTELPVVAATSADSHRRLQFLSRQALQEELDLVSRACELYSRNYFAWTHRLMCMKSLLSDYLVGTDTVGFVPAFRDEIAAIKRWIDQHVSDYSAIHTIFALSQAVLYSENHSLRQTIIEGKLLDHAISLVQEYPTHEALWMYLRVAQSISDSRQAQQLQRLIDDFVLPLARTQQPTINGTDGLVEASQYAMQFLNRRRCGVAPSQRA